MNHIRTVFRVSSRELVKADLDMHLYSGQARKDMRLWRTAVLAVVRTTNAGKKVPARLHRRIEELSRTHTIQRHMWGLK